MSELIGKGVDRVDGRLKVTGGATFAAERLPDRIAYGVLIQSTIANGRIRSFDTSAAQKVPGVITILTHLNAPKLKKGKSMMEGGGTAENTIPLQDAKIAYAGQNIGVVIADSFERATEAAMLVTVNYQTEKPTAFWDADPSRAAYAPGPIWGEPPDKKHGDPDTAFASAPVKIDATYSTPTEHHNPMEPHALVAIWSGDQLLVYDGTQYVSGEQSSLSTIFGIPPGNVRVVSPFVGGGFGTKATTWSHIPIAAMAARVVKRPVKLVLTRKQMYSVTGHRSATHQRVALGANADGKLTSIIHETTNYTSMNEEFVEPAAGVSGMMYAAPNRRTSHRLVKLNRPVPTFQRAPGESTGSFALESAMDELAWKLGMDPITLRNLNDTPVNPENGMPWSSKSLRQCFEQGAAKFGWSRRSPEPRSMRDGRYLIGMGVGSATFPAFSMPTSAKITIFANGSALVQSGAQEMGMGTATVMSQVAAEYLGIPVERVRFELGDTRLPRAGVAGGSATASSVGSAVKGTADAMRAKVLTLIGEDSPLKGAKAEDLGWGDGRLFLKSDPSRGESYSDILRRKYMDQVEVSHDAMPAQSKYASHAFGAQFAEVRVDPDLGEVRVSRFTGAFAAGRILNAKTARSQFLGGITWGIGMALHEETHMDANLARFTNANIAEYLIPVNLDVPDIDVIMVEEVDPYVNPIGTKGIGEVGIVGAAAAIANAVYHATGKRIRDLPITVEKLL